MTWNAAYDGVGYDHFINNVCITCSIRREEKKNESSAGLINRNVNNSIAFQSKLPVRDV